MSSTGRYQSRFLSFLSQQSLQWRDRALEALRQTRLNLTWGMQVVLYPVYVLFQSGRLVGQQLRQAVDRLLPLLAAVKADDFDPAVGVPPLDSDAPIHNTLRYLESFALPIIISPRALPQPNGHPLAGRSATPSLKGGDPHRDSPSLAYQSDPASLAPGSPGTMSPVTDASLELPPHSSTVTVQDAATQTVNVTQVVRGLACLMETQSIVLVDTQNQVLDILTPEQQIRLHQRILLETASFYRDQQLRLRAAQATRLSVFGNALGRGRWRFLPPPRTRPSMVAPVRAFVNLMGWMQASPVAIATNLFQESVLASLVAGGEGQPHPSLASSQIPSLPQSGSNSNQESPQSRPPFWQRFLQAVGLALLGTPPTPQSGGNSTPDVSTPNQWFDPDRQGSIEGWFSANDFSLGRRHSKHYPPSMPTRSRWMPSWAGEWFQGGDSIITDPNEPTNPDVEEATRSAASTSSSPRSVLTRHTGVNTTDDVGDRLITVDSPDPDSELMPTLVDTRATLVGYVKHPLEQLLEWIDLGMVWIEDLASRIWTWLRKKL